jgi:hypothetical protein
MHCYPVATAPGSDFVLCTKYKSSQWLLNPKLLTGSKLLIITSYGRKVTDAAEKGSAPRESRSAMRSVSHCGSEWVVVGNTESGVIMKAGPPTSRGVILTSLQRDSSMTS